MNPKPDPRPEPAKPDMGKPNDPALLWIAIGIPAAVVILFVVLVLAQ
jgi:hypothetical protein